MMDDLEPNQSYRDQSNHYKIPCLEDNTPLDSSRMNASLIGLNNTSDKPVVNFIKNLERFCNDVAENKLLWTPEVITFFGITDETLKREYEFAREEI